MAVRDAVADAYAEWLDQLEQERQNAKDQLADDAVEWVLDTVLYSKAKAQRVVNRNQLAVVDVDLDNALAVIVDNDDDTLHIAARKAGPEDWRVRLVVGEPGNWAAKPGTPSHLTDLPSLHEALADA